MLSDEACGVSGLFIVCKRVCRAERDVLDSSGCTSDIGRLVPKALLIFLHKLVIPDPCACRVSLMIAAIGHDTYPCTVAV